MNSWLIVSVQSSECTEAGSSLMIGGGEGYYRRTDASSSPEDGSCIRILIKRVASGGVSPKRHPSVARLFAAHGIQELAHLDELDKFCSVTEFIRALAFLGKLENCFV